MSQKSTDTESSSKSEVLTSLQVTFTIEHEDPVQIIKVQSDFIEFLQNLNQENFNIVRCTNTMETRLKFPNR